MPDLREGLRPSNGGAETLQIVSIVASQHLSERAAEPHPRSAALLSLSTVHSFPFPYLPPPLRSFASVGHQPACPALGARRGLCISVHCFVMGGRQSGEPDVLRASGVIGWKGCLGERWFF